jgi:hypothetical protein
VTHSSNIANDHLSIEMAENEAYSIFIYNRAIDLINELLSVMGPKKVNDEIYQVLLDMSMDVHGMVE